MGIHLICCFSHIQPQLFEQRFLRRVLLGLQEVFSDPLYLNGIAKARSLKLSGRCKVGWSWWCWGSMLVTLSISNFKTNKRSFIPI